MRYTKILTLGEDRVEKIKEVIVSCDFTRSHDSIELALSSIKYDNIKNVAKTIFNKDIKTNTQRVLYWR